MTLGGSKASFELVFNNFLGTLKYHKYIYEQFFFKHIFSSNFNVIGY